MRFLLLAIVAVVARAARGPSACEGADFAWCDHTKDLEARVKAIVSNLTNDEKAGLFVNGASGVKRINWPAYNWLVAGRR